MVQLSTRSILWLASCVLLQSTIIAETVHSDYKIEWKELNQKLPIPLSDMTATFLASDDDDDSSNDIIIIAGGCSSPQGNQKDGDYFSCFDVTDKVYAFYPATGVFEELQSMLSTRYRHAATVIGGKLYVVGGRDDEEAMVAGVDVYDRKSNSWSTLRTLPDQYLTSDNAAFDHEGKLYVVGGYDEEYNAKTSVLEIDLDTKGIVPMTGMQTPRGDASAVSYDFEDKTVAFIIGGFTHVNGFCRPLDEAEMYDFEENEWVYIPALNVRRGDKALVVLNGKIIAIGGERKHEEKCGESRMLSESRMLGEEGSGSMLVDEVEVYDPRDSDPAWKFETNLKEHRYRAAAAAVDSSNSVYVFGGQKEYAFDCECYPTSNTIYHYQELDDTSSVKVRAEVSVTVLVLSLYFVGVLM